MTNLILVSYAFVDAEHEHNFLKSLPVYQLYNVIDGYTTSQWQ